MASGLQLVLVVGLVTGLVTVKASSARGADRGDADSSRCSVCPPGWTQFGSRCFSYFRTYRTWSDAEKYCISIGGNLASIHNNEENDFLSEYIHRMTGGYYHTWIGATDAVKESTWMWSDGSRLDFVRWGNGQPNNAGGYQHCVEMNAYGNFWDDENCNTSNCFVCAKDL